MPSYPGAEAYADRHARAAAIPLEQRSRDTRTFLEAHQLLDQAAAVLSSSNARGSDRAVAVLQRATTAFSGVDLQPNMLTHPACLVALKSGHTAALMRPLVSPRCFPGTDLVMGFDVDDRLIQQLASTISSPVHSVQTIARLLLVARLLTGLQQEWEVGPLQQARRAASVFAALQRSLQDEGAAQAMRAELARMQRASSAAGTNWRVPTLEQLLAAAAFQELYYMTWLGQAMAKEPLPDEMWQLCWQRKDLAVRILERVQPHSPRTHVWLGVRSAEVDSTDPSAGATAARHFRHGLAIARQQQSDWWTARLAYKLAVFATTNQLAAVSPAEAAGLLAEADAAYRRCHTVLPWLWVAELRDEQVSGRAMQPAIEAHTQRGAAGWDNALRQLGSQCYSEGSSAVEAYRNATTCCAGCGRVSMALRCLPGYPVLQVGRRLRGGGGLWCQRLPTIMH